MKKTGTGINELINHSRKKVENISVLKDEKSGQLIHDPKKLPVVRSKHFASCASGAILAAKLPHSERHQFSEYFDHSQKSFYFNHVTPAELESEIPLLPTGKSDGAYSRRLSS